MKKGSFPSAGSSLGMNTLWLGILEGIISARSFSRVPCDGRLFVGASFLEPFLPRVLMGEILEFAKPPGRPGLFLDKSKGKKGGL